MASQSTASIIGKPIDRVDGRKKVTGQALYAADFPIRNIAYAVAFQSTIGNGKIKSIDVTEARTHPGVLEVITHENAPKLYHVSMDHEPGMPGQTFMPLQGDEIKYPGQYLGLVVAENVTQALAAAGLVKISYQPQKPIVRMEDNLAQAFEPKKMARGSKPNADRGNVDEALAQAPVKIDQTYVTPTENHNPIELSASIAEWNGDKLTLYTATQFVYGARGVVSTWLGIDQENVRVIDPYVGGAFGCKGSTWPHEVLAAIAAKKVNRPVQLMLTRAQMFSGIGYRPQTIQRVALGADRNGNLTSLIHECQSETCAWKDEWVEPATKQSRMLYSCPNLRTVQKLVPINANTPTQMRAPGHATGTFALEVAMDELAYATGVDPVELRLLNYADKDEDENLPFSSKELKACYRQAAERFGWNRRTAQPRSMRDGKYLMGMGMATATYPTNQQESSAQIKILANGRAVVSAAAHDLGTGAYTVLAMIASETLGICVEKIKVELADTDLPQAPVAGGSQTTASVGSAVKVTALKAIKALKERAGADPQSPLYKKSAKEIAVGDERIFVKSHPDQGEMIAALLQRNGGRPVEAKGDTKPPAKPDESADDPSQSKDHYSKHAWGAQFAEVAIDEELGEIRVRRIVSAFAAGRIINAKTAHSQIMGGIVGGVGMALMEHTIRDPQTAKIVNDNLADYLLPINADIGDIDCFFVEEKDPYVNALGVKGIGEIGITGIAAAVANAVFHATGKRIRELPITLDKML